MARVILCLGGAWNVWDDFERAKALCEQAGVDYHVGAVNDAGADYRGHLHLWCTLHPEKLRDKEPRWQKKREDRGLNQDYLIVSHKPRVNTRVDKVVPEVWSGSSGLYVHKVAIVDLGYTRSVACGTPMNEEGHYFDNSGWRHSPNYWKGWVEAHDQPELAGRIKSMSGRTRDLLGEPDIDWLAGGA